MAGQEELFNTGSQHGEVGVEGIGPVATYMTASAGSSATSLCYCYGELGRLNSKSEVVDLQTIEV